MPLFASQFTGIALNIIALAFKIMFGIRLRACSFKNHFGAYGHPGTNFSV
jgi:hypothetical protein